MDRVDWGIVIVPRDEQWRSLHGEHESSMPQNVCVNVIRKDRFRKRVVQEVEIVSKMCIFKAGIGKLRVVSKVTVAAAAEKVEQ